MNETRWIGQSGRVAIVVAALGLLAASRGSAQVVGRSWVPTYRFGAGYVIDAPMMMVGGGGFVVTPFLGGLGLYVDAKTGVDSPSKKANYDPTLTAQQVQNQYPDQFFTSKSMWRSFNVALMRPVTAELMLYLGGGWAVRSDYNQYYDPQGVRGVQGYYWVRKESTSGGRLNFMGGMVVRMGSNINGMFGVESAPTGFTVGLFLAFPGAPS